MSVTFYTNHRLPTTRVSQYFTELDQELCAVLWLELRRLR